MTKEELIEEMEDLKDVLDTERIDSYIELLKKNNYGDSIYRRISEKLKDIETDDSYSKSIYEKWALDLNSIFFSGNLSTDIIYTWDELLIYGKVSVKNETLVSVDKNLQGVLIIPSSIKNIGDDCFRDCRYLTEIKLPEGLSKFGFGNFLNCDSLERIYFPRSFDFCNYWRNVFIPKKLKEVHFSKSFVIYSHNFFNAVGKYKVYFDNY